MRFGEESVKGSGEEDKAVALVQGSANARNADKQKATTYMWQAAKQH